MDSLSQRGRKEDCRLPGADIQTQAQCVTAREEMHGQSQVQIVVSPATDYVGHMCDTDV